MGYTHYFELNSQPSKEDVDTFVSAVKNIISASDVAIVDGMGGKGTAPIVDDKMIYLNGEGEDSHETLLIDFEEQEWSFVKTNEKPYDEVVVAILMKAEEMLDFSWTSDGSVEGGFFDKAIDLHNLRVD